MATDKKSPDKKKSDQAIPRRKIPTTRFWPSLRDADNADELETLIKNAAKLGNVLVAEAAFRKRISLVPAEQPGSVEHDFWQMVQAFEFTLSEERGKNTRLAGFTQEGRKSRRYADAPRLGRRQPGNRGFQNAAGARHAGVHR